MKFSQVLDSVIEYTFYILIFLVPLLWLPFTSELFEFNKMILVYLGASVVVICWLIKSLHERSFSFQRTPFDIPIALFLIAHILSTIFSIDSHTSIFGYYGRFNGGLLSTIAYIVLFYGALNFLTEGKWINSLKLLLLSSALVAVYAILQHPTPLFRTGDGSFRGIDAGYWQQDAQARAFSTLGHPNWLAAFMAMVLPFSIAFMILTKRWWEKAIFALFSILYFLAFTFSYSRGGSLGLLAAAITFAGIATVLYRKKLMSYFSKIKVSHLIENLKFPGNGFFISFVLLIYILILFFFGNALYSRGVNFEAISAGDTQLASSGPETGKIRLIVWKGAFETFKSYPLLGTGVETFAYSYYKDRPPEHNYTSEWSFLYNKAHNEFVNYLSTMGLLGITAYLWFIVTFFVVVTKYLYSKIDNWKKLLIISATASIVGYHVQNFFGFSVVPIALLFFLMPAFVMLLGEKKVKIFSFKIPYLENLNAKIAYYGAAILLGIMLIFITFAMWFGDIFYAASQNAGSLVQAKKHLETALILRPDEPLYKAQLGWISMNQALREDDEKQKNVLVGESFKYLNEAIENSPNNIVIWRIRLQSIYDLAQAQSEYTEQLVKTAKTVGDLAPTEAEIQYTLGSMYVFAREYEKAQEQIEKVVNMKLNYLDAWKLLFEIDNKLGNRKDLEKHLEKFKKHFPEQSGDAEFIKKYDLK